MDKQEYLRHQNSLSELLPEEKKEVQGEGDAAYLLHFFYSYYRERWQTLKQNLPDSNELRELAKDLAPCITYAHGMNWIRNLRNLSTLSLMWETRVIAGKLEKRIAAEIRKLERAVPVCRTAEDYLSPGIDKLCHAYKTLVEIGRYKIRVPASPNLQEMTEKQVQVESYATRTTQLQHKYEGCMLTLGKGELDAMNDDAAAIIKWYGGLHIQPARTLKQLHAALRDHRQHFDQYKKIKQEICTQVELMKQGHGAFTPGRYSQYSSVPALHPFVDRYNAACTMYTKRKIDEIKKQTNVHVPVQHVPYEQRFITVEDMFKQNGSWKEKIAGLKARLEGWLEQSAWPTTLIDWEVCYTARGKLLQEREHGTLATYLQNNLDARCVFDKMMTTLDNYLVHARMHLAGTEL